jgi:DNA helicase-2/ATP-dependent DNA helicase PcrA
MKKPWRDNLNQAQKKAVTHEGGPLKVVAGAGTGKTRVLTRRIAHLISEDIPADQILALTFTNKAAKEMKERVHKIAGTDAVLVSTFHALGARILRRHADKLAVSEHFTICDTSKSRTLIRQVLKDAGFDPKEWKPKKIQGFISNQKSEGQDAEEFMSQVTDEVGFEPVVAEVWPRYENAKTRQDVLDFSDLVLSFRDLLDNNPQVRRQYQKRFRHVLVDEYQDTSRLQAEITSQLARPQNNLFVVGDGDQTIYSWRGANVENILSFENQFQNAETVVLETNYRSGSHIIQAANDVIRHNQRRDEKNLQAHTGAGEKLEIHNAHNETHEAQLIVQRVENHKQSGGAPDDWTVLYRTNAQSRAIEEALLSADISYDIAGTSFFDRKEVRDVLAYIRLALNPNAETDLRRIISRPRRGIGEKTVEKMLAGDTLSAHRQQAVDEFWDTIDQIKHHIHHKVPSQAIADSINTSGLADFYEDESRQDNMAEIADMAASYDPEFAEDPSAMRTFLENIAVESDQDRIGGTGVTLMTVHAAKGLEFPRVWIAGLEDGLFPSDRGNQPENEEERRLFYVALTRAQEKVVLSHASSRRTYGQREWQTPSPFLDHISDELVENSHQTGEGGDEDVIFFD